MGRKDTSKARFSSLYTICSDKDHLVSSCWEGDGWNVSFIRALGDRDIREWEILMDKLKDYKLNDEMDDFLGAS